MFTYSQQSAEKVIKQEINLYLSPDYNSLYKYNLEEDAFSNTKDVRIKYYIIRPDRQQKATRELREF